MKKITLIVLIITSINSTSFAQIKKRDIYNPATTIDNSRKMPDLVITNLKVSDKYTNANGVGVRDITYEIKNIGNAAPEYFVELQGYITNDDVYDWKTMAKGCSDIVENATVLLAPGKSFTKTFTCGTAIIKQGYRNYVLKADFRNKTIESNENNNHNLALINNNN